MQSSYSIELNVFRSKVRYKPQHLSKGSVYDCIFTASCSYYLGAATVKAMANNRYVKLQVLCYMCSCAACMCICRENVINRTKQISIAMHMNRQCSILSKTVLHY